MNRIIKFRAWDSINKQFIANGDAMDLYYSAKCNAFMFDNDNYDLGKGIVFLQFTGLKDKNGKEIYENDIVNTVNGNAVVRYDERIGCFRMEYNEKNCSLFLDFFMEKLTFTLIGNIHDNPELLKQEDI
jgi:uncharacterized phage protein (TIGR01671 family)